jgi:hypothetical protein
MIGYLGAAELLDKFSHFSRQGAQFKSIVLKWLVSCCRFVKYGSSIRCISQRDMFIRQADPHTEF